jgi:hypothetical protein
MRFPFTGDQFFDVFGKYNLAIWPIQIFTYLLGITAVALVFSRIAARHKIISGILAFYWIWMGIVYHIIFFSPINPAARIFGILFVVQGLLFIYYGIILNAIQFKPSINAVSIIGFIFILYALIVYPFIGKQFGHAYPKIPIFGVAPCPTTIFTFGVLLLIGKPISRSILIIPFIWSIIGMSAAVNLRVPQDYGLFVAGIAGTTMILFLNKRLKIAQKQADSN